MNPLEEAALVLYASFSGVQEPLPLHSEHGELRPSLRAMQEFDDKKRCIEQAAQEVQSRWDARIAAVVSEINARLPFHRFPTEVLSNIFQYAADDKGQDCLYILGELSRVCQRWKYVIEQTPRLWSQITITCPSNDQLKVITEAVLGKAIRLSQKHPLLVSVGASAEGELDLQALAPQLRNQAHRWDTLILDVCDEDNLSFFLEHPAPILRTLEAELCLTDEDDNQMECSRPFTILEGTAPQLLNVRLKNIQPFWDSPIFSGLRKLVVEDITFPLSQIVNVLASCPSLLLLSLVGLIVPYGDEIMGPNSIQLLDLRKLVIQSHNASLIKTLISGIHSPACSELGISCSSSQPSFSILHTSALSEHVRRWLKSIDIKTLYIGLACLYDGIAFTFGREVGQASIHPGFDGGIAFVTRRDETPTAVRWLVGLCSEELPDIEFAVRVSDDIFSHLRPTRHLNDTERAQLLAIQNAFDESDRVSSLEFFKPAPDAADWIEWLTLPVVSSDIARWRFPRLSRLFVDHRISPHILDQVLRLVQVRCGTLPVNVPIGDVPVQYPVCLREVERLHDDESRSYDRIYRKIDKILGNARLSVHS